MRTMTSSAPVVNSHNEWDPLEEVIVGRIDDWTVMPWEPAFEAIVPADYVETVKAFHEARGGRRHKDVHLPEAQKQLDHFVHVLESEGVIVRRPDPIDVGKPFSTPEFSSQG